MQAFDAVAARTAEDRPGSLDGQGDVRLESRIELLRPADLASLLARYRSSLPIGAGTEPRLLRVVADTLAGPGSLVRAQLALALSEALGTERGRAADLAIGIEYFHTASLLFDDLPAMDNARARRGRACPHVVHGEAAAILAALAFVNQGYALLWGVLGELPRARQARARRLVAGSLGLSGILNGQALDLRFGDVARPGARAVLRVADGKTVSLLRLTLLLPAIVGGAEGLAVRGLARLASAWGRSYQILDDFTDCDVGGAVAGKTTARDAPLARPNLPLTVGRESALDELDALLARARAALASLGSLRAACPALDRLERRLERERTRIAVHPVRVGATVHPA